MKKLLFILSLISISFIGEAQRVVGTLSNATAQKMGDNLLVCGVDETQTPSVFDATIYDKKLKVLKHFSKKLGAEFKGSNFGLIILASTIQVSFYCRGHCPDEYLELTTNLEEKTSGIAAFSPKVSFMHIALEPDSPIYGFDNPGQKFLGEDLVSVFYTSSLYYSPGVFAYTAVPYVGLPSVKRVLIKDSMGQSTFKIKWDSDLGLYLAKTHDVFYIGNDVIYFLVSGNELNKEEHTFLYIVDSKTGKVLTKEIVEMPGNKADLRNAKGYFDAENNRIIIAGEANQSDKKIGILFYDNFGKFINVSGGNIPILDGTLPPRGYLMNRDENFVKAVGKNTQGNYFVQTETTVKKESNQRMDGNGNAYNNMFKDVPVAYSYYEVNGKNEIKDSKLIPITNFADYSTAKFYDASPNGKSMLISNLFEKKRTTEIVNFTTGSKSFKKLFEFPFTPRKVIHEDYVHQFMMDDETVIVLHRINDSSFELEAEKY